MVTLFLATTLQFGFMVYLLIFLNGSTTISMIYEDNNVMNANVA
ncbi:hypothetical protein ALT785_250030 [Alteromonas infernus]